MVGLDIVDIIGAAVDDVISERGYSGNRDSLVNSFVIYFSLVDLGGVDPDVVYAYCAFLVREVLEKNPSVGGTDVYCMIDCIGKDRERMEFFLENMEDYKYIPESLKKLREEGKKVFYLARKKADGDEISKEDILKYEEMLPKWYTSILVIEGCSYRSAGDLSDLYYKELREYSKDIAYLKGSESYSSRMQGYLLASKCVKCSLKYGSSFDRKNEKLLKNIFKG